MSVPANVSIQIRWYHTELLESRRRIRPCKTKPVMIQDSLEGKCAGAHASFANTDKRRCFEKEKSPRMALDGDEQKTERDTETKGESIPLSAGWPRSKLKWMESVDGWMWKDTQRQERTARELVPHI